MTIDICHAFTMQMDLRWFPLPGSDDLQKFICSVGLSIIGLKWN